MRKKLLFSVVLSSFMLIGCGGGGSGSDAPITTEEQPPITEEQPPTTNPDPDIVAPVITLIGDAVIYLTEGDTYIEEGATANDEVDGTLTVTITGGVDTSEPSTYIITYTAEDLSGNSSSITREVVVSKLIMMADKNDTLVDLLLIYGNGTEALYGNDVTTRLNHLVTITNKVYKDSNTSTFFKAVIVKDNNLDDTKSSLDMINNTVDNTELAALRDSENVDEVIIYKPYSGDGFCGVAWINTILHPNYAYAVVAVDCPTDTSPHELGHNFGLDHSHPQNSVGIYPYSLGHGEDGLFSTIMAYTDAFNTTKTTMIFSNPLADCFGSPCGIEEGYDGEADATRTINETKQAISEFR